MLTRGPLFHEGIPNFRMVMGGGGGGRVGVKLGMGSSLDFRKIGTGHGIPDFT